MPRPTTNVPAAKSLFIVRLLPIKNFSGRKELVRHIFLDFLRRCGRIPDRQEYQQANSHQGDGTNDRDEFSVTTQCVPRFFDG